MDPLAHTLVGATLARTRLARSVPLALPTLLVAANLPDVDILCYATGSDAALLGRRGWSHGILSLLVLPLLLTGAVLAIHRWRLRRGGPDPPPPAGRVVLLAAVGVATHPFLDWLNTYGVRLLAPFDWRWFYGDALFIIDPWVWLLLGGTVFLCAPGKWWSLGVWVVLGAAAAALVVGGGRVEPAVARAWSLGVAAVVGARLAGLAPRTLLRRERLATAALITLGVYIGGAVASSQLVAGLARGELERVGVAPVEDLMVDPRPGNPLGWRILAATPDSYHRFAFRWLERPRLVAVGAPIARRADSAIATAARQAPHVRGYMSWVRFPYYEIDGSSDGGYTVYILDARYMRRRTTGFGATVVHLSPDLEPLVERAAAAGPQPGEASR